MSAHPKLALLPLVLSALFLGCADSATRPPDMERALSLREALGDSGGSTQESAEPEGPEPTGWGTLRGRFVIQGDPPERQRLPVGGDDAEICAPGGAPVLSKQMLVGADGGIKNVLLFVATELPADEPWTHPDMQPGTEGEFVFDQEECTFLSHVFAMQAGHTLRILNSDPVGHNTKIENTPVNQIVASGGEITYMPNDEWKSPAAVSCSIHPWMSAYMLVRNNGYFAVTDENGNFELPNLPAGVDVEIRVWHELTKFIDGVTIDGQQVRKGRFTVNLSPDGKSIDVPLDASLFQ